MKILVINGANLNMLGIREPEIYGKGSYEELCNMIKRYCSDKGIDVELFQSNHEGCIVDKIQQAYGTAEGIVINPGAYTHTSIAIPDALRCVNIPTVEVHISDTDNREEYRKINYTRPVCVKTYKGMGFDGYIKAIEFLWEYIK